MCAHTPRRDSALHSATGSLCDAQLCELIECVRTVAFPRSVCVAAPAGHDDDKRANVGDDDGDDGNCDGYKAPVARALRRIDALLRRQLAHAFYLHNEPAAVATTAPMTPLRASSDIARRLGLLHTLALTCHRPLRSPHAPASSSSSLTNTRQQAERQRDASFAAQCVRRAHALVDAFMSQRLSHVVWLLSTDVAAMALSDVAVTSVSEVAVCYPGVVCMLHHRLAHQLYLMGAPNVYTRLLTERAHTLTGIDIHPHAAIGHHFCIDHGTGIVIGGTAVLGNYVSLYQGVTLGARSFRVDEATGDRIKQLPRHPIVEDGVTIYAGTSILGRVTIGEGSIIGAGCFIMRDVPPYSSLARQPTHTLQRSKSPTNEPFTTMSML